MNYFYGILLVMLGFLILAPYIFKIKIPIFVASTSIIVVFLGVTLFTHGPGLESDNDIVFSSKTVQVTNPAKKYNLTFSGGTIDLSNVIPRHKGEKIIINNVFSCGTIKIKPETPATIKISSAFAVAKTPDKSSVYFGSYNYKTKSFIENANYFDIEVKTIFGTLNIDDMIKTKTVQ
ncbi:hypothetical protein L9W92_00275 [Pelotomaculum terephthalicicum JT]|uniref:hypothetical protein n=1 Tax=Pelotomaculum TaxID=191373 RepID=UPI001F035900|nr:MULTISPECIES: hypothetical protein [Pelotomaculum]MCG9966493.1 hypothetical protein [Pelotomaculum terephthalicicum JT]